MAKKRIWWQSSTRLEVLPGYKEAIEEHAKIILSDNYEVEMHGVECSANMDKWHYCELLNSREIMENFIYAQDQGFDCIAIGCFNDPCITEAREILDIPVVGISETSFMWAKMLGTSGAVISIDDIASQKKMSDNIRRYGYSDFMLPIIDCPMTLDAMIKALSDPEEAMIQYRAACDKAVEMGAEVIIPGCGLLAVLSAKFNFTKVGDTGVTILDGVGALMKMAEAAIVLHEVMGITPSRKGQYKQPDRETVDFIRKCYGILK